MVELKWYVVRVVSGQEKKAKAYLEKEVSIHQYEKEIAEVITPSEKVFQLRKAKDGKTKKIAVEKNFYPGYMFVSANLNNGEITHLIKSVPGVIGFLNVEGSGANEVPRPMRESEVKRMLGKMEDNEVREVNHDTVFSIGETVKVMDGPFNGFSGVVQEVFDEKKKINVMVKIFGRNAPIELNYVQVEREQ